ncbi:MAG: FtsX-like permease family protein [Bacteroidota bacterium]
MWKNHLKIALRSLGKNKLFTGLNMLGLALGLSVASLLLLYVQDELSFNSSHQKKDDIYRVLVHADFDGQKETLGTAPNAVGPTAKESIAGVKEQVRFMKHNFGDKAFINAGDKKLVESDLYWVDASLFDVFDIHLIYGNPAEALNEPNQILLSESAALRYFDRINPLGESLTIDGRHVMNVTGVYEDLPQNISFDAQMIGSFLTPKWMQKQTWSNSSYETYLLLEQNVEVSQVEQAMSQLIEDNVPVENRWYTFSLQSLNDIHLYSADISSAYSARLGDPKQLKLLSLLVIIIILIACINYMNMSTARSQRKAKEVGINKAVGATRGQLIRQFYTETAVLIGFSFLLSFVLILIFTPIFNFLAEKSFSFLDFLNPNFFVGSLLIALVITLISGAYPALYLSRFSPKSLFQNTTYSSGKGGASIFRKGLVILQFTASVVIIVATLVFFKQLQFAQQGNLGYQPELVVGILTAGAENVSQINALNNGLRQMTEVVAVGRTQSFPGNGGSGRTIAKPEDNNQVLPIESNRAGAEIVDLLGLHLLAGKTLPNRAVTKEDSVVQVILNETAVEFLGYTPEAAIGRSVPELFWQKRADIVGVVEDFHFESFHKPIAAYAFHNNPSEWRSFTLVKLSTDNLSSSMQKVKATFEQTIPNSAFEYTFIDEHLETLYRAEQKVARIFLVFAVLTIFIACLGLFGLTAYTAERRRKEIGIRKVLGATVFNITKLLSLDFLKLVMLALLIAIPVAWYIMHLWLENFAYHINIQWWIFALAGTTATIIALFTMSFQSVKAALVNPIGALRSEG